MNRLIAGLSLLLLGLATSAHGMLVHQAPAQVFVPAVSESPYAFVIDADCGAENYCRNNPIDNVDSLGLADVDVNLINARTVELDEFLDASTDASYQARRAAGASLQTGAKVAQVTLNTVVDVTPGLSQGVILSTGESASGTLSWWEKGLAFIPALSAVREVKTAMKVVRAAEDINDVRKGLTAVRRFEKGASAAPRLERAVASRLATGADEAVFWSGIRNGESTAAKWASSSGGATLETTLAARGVRLPVWDANNPATVAAWRNASAEFAAGAKGHVRVLQSDAVRLKSTWVEVEFPVLRANPNVTSIRAVNPETGVETLLWKR